MKQLFPFPSWLRQMVVPAILLGALLLCSCGKDHWVPRSFDPGDTSLEVRKGSHRVALLEDGRTALLYRLFLLRHAKHSIRIQTFILADDPIGVLVMEELVRAAQRGVTVQFLIDAMFTDVSPERLAMLSGMNDRMTIRIYNPPTSQIAPNFLKLSGGAITSWRRFNQRMHNKLLVVDDHVAICGGRNIADEYYDADFNLNFLDLDIVVEGPRVQDMSKSFKEYWGSPLVVPIKDMSDVAAARTEVNDQVTSPHISEAEVGSVEAEPAHHEPLLRWHHVQHVAFWADPPHKPEPEEDPDAIARRLGALLAQTQEDLLLQSPYLVLSDQAIKVFKSLRERQVRIRVSTNSLAATDNWLSYAHSLRQRRTMLRDLKFQIYEMKAFPDDLLRYMPNYNHLRAKASRTSSDEPPGPPDPKLCLHTKALVMDKRISLVGTYNLDPRSARLNTENGVVIWDSSFAQYLSLKIRRDMDHANSWVVAKRFLPLPLEPLQMLLEEVNELVMSITSLDVWPLRYSSLFDLEDGMEPVHPDHPEFYERYRQVGLFPGVEPLDLKPILVELTRMLTGLFRPLI